MDDVRPYLPQLVAAFGIFMGGAAGATLQVAFYVDELHFFDPQTELAIRPGIAQPEQEAAPAVS